MGIMRNKFQRANSIFYFLGKLLHLLGLIFLLPMAVVLIYWHERGDGWLTLYAFAVSSFLCFLVGSLLRRSFKFDVLDKTGAMLMCVLAWLVFSALGALPFCIILGAPYLDGVFEAMSGFTTTGITLFTGLDGMPHSILFWRALTHLVGGLGILSFFMLLTFSGGEAHYVLSAESHKIAMGRPSPGIFSSVRIFWILYGLFTILGILLLSLLGMSVFDSVCHTFAALSTGGFSPHDASIAYYAENGYRHYQLMEYVLILIMILGGMNFLIHFRVITGKIKALWDNLEMRYWWFFIALFTGVILSEHMYKTGTLNTLFRRDGGLTLAGLEETIRICLFQVVSIITTTGFATRDIGSSFFPPLSRQLFLVMMVIGGCVGSTGGGIKVLRIAILKRLLGRVLFRTRVSEKASSSVIVDKTIIPTYEVNRVSSLFFAWVLFLVIGGGITAHFSSLSGWAAMSGMFSALGNIGPSYISIPDMINIHPVVKLTYIFGMLAGRLEIIPVLLFFSKKAWI